MGFQLYIDLISILAFLKYIFNFYAQISEQKIDLVIH